MKRQIVSSLILILILAVTSTLMYGISLADADVETGENHDDMGYGEQVIIVEHRISARELERLKQKFGVFEEGRDYNPTINGYGTGLRPPTEAEWTEIADKSYSVEQILLNQPAQPPPSSVDHTDTMWFPPIGDQDGEGSCTAWAVGYYMKTFQEAKEHDWNLTEAEWIGGYTGEPTPAYQDRIMSPDFVYHLVNDGVDEGSAFYDAIMAVREIGCSSWATMPYDPVDHASWPPEAAWREAPLYRGNSTGFESMLLATDDNITSLKNWLASEHLAVIGVDGNQYDNFPTGLDEWTLDNYVEPIILNHANTIVGYDDDYIYMEEGEWRSGAFKIANSWGEGGWEDITDGCYWISYEAMKQRVEYAMFYRDRIAYDPQVLAVFNLDHTMRAECNISIGMGNTTTPLTTKSFSNWTNGGEQPFCSNNVVLDVTEFHEGLSTVIDQPFFLQVYDQAAFPPHSGTHYWYSDGITWSWFRLNQTFTIPVTGATLNFWTYYEIEADYDYGYVEVHDLDADQWYTLNGTRTISTLPAQQDNPNTPSQFEPRAYFFMKRWHAFTGVSGPMYEETMDLTPFADHTIELYFTYWTDGFELEHGWYVDDIAIPEIGFFDDVESGPTGWTYNGWDITTIPPSADGEVLAFAIEHYNSYLADSLKANASSYDVPLNTTNLEDVYAFTIAGDVDGDRYVGSADAGVLNGAYGSWDGELLYVAETDFDEDGYIGSADASILNGNYGKSC